MLNRERLRAGKGVIGGRWQSFNYKVSDSKDWKERLRVELFAPEMKGRHDIIYQEICCHPPK